MKYAYEDLSDSQFEKLIVLVCQRLFGISVQGFTPGADGGRDAKFVGTLKCILPPLPHGQERQSFRPKHTNGINKNFSESDFYSKKGGKTILSEEVIRIKALREKKLVDNYIGSCQL